ncbi:hypothetical protein Tco_0134285 [Tanacetum coccineum]
MDAMAIKIDDQYKEMKSRTESLNLRLFVDKQSARPSGSLQSNTQPNHGGSSSKSYQHHIHKKCDDEDEEPTPQPQTPKLNKEAPTPKSYKPRIPYHQRLRKLKIEAQYGKFLDMIRAVRINVPLIDVLAGMPNYAFLSDESSAITQNKVQPKLGDPKSFLIPAMKHSYSNNDPCFSIDVIDEILEEDFNALLDEGSKILYFIEGTPLEDKLFAEFDEFIAMNIEENTNPNLGMDGDMVEDHRIKYFHFLDGFSRYFQLPIDPMDQEKTTFTFPFGTYSYRRMLFGLCNAPATFQRCMLAIFQDMIEESVEVVGFSYEHVLAIKRVDEYGFVIRRDLVALTSGSVGPFYSINTVPVIKAGFKNLLDLGFSISKADLYRYPVDNKLDSVDSRKSPTTVLFDDDTRRISIRLYEY